MLQVSIDTHKMGGYPSYFVEDIMIHLGHGYAVKIRVYYAWDKDILTLIRFKHIHSDLHPEAKKYFCGEKFYQMRYFIRLFND